MVQHQGWGTSTEHRWPELQRGQFLYAVFTDGKGAVWHAGLYDFHAGQGKGAERIEGGTLLPGGLLELQHQGQEREEDYHGPVPPSQQGGAGELQGETPYMKTYNVFNVNQTNLKEVKPELYEQLENRFKSPALKDEKGMFAMPLLDVMIREGKWVCPILPKEGNQAYYARGEKDGHIVVPLKGQFEDGESFYATLMHEMAHSTGEVHLLNREKGVVFGDDKYAKEELIAELTAATTGQAMGITTSIREENAMYLKNWLAALKEDPKFIYSILSDVGKASGMIQERSQEMFSLLSQEEKFMVGVIQGNKELLDDLKKEGFVPAPELMERIDSSHLTEGMKEHLDRQFGIADKPESVSFTLEDVMASVPLRKMYMKDMMELNLEINDRTANDWMEAYQERKTMNNDFILAL